MHPAQAIAVGFGMIAAAILGAQVGRALGSGSELPGPGQAAAVAGFAAAVGGMNGSVVQQEMTSWATKLDGLSGRGEG